MTYEPYAYMYDANTVLFGVKDASGRQVLGGLRSMADAELETAALEGRDMDRQRTAVMPRRPEGYYHATPGTFD